MGRQHPGMDVLDTGRRHEESGETRGVSWLPGHMWCPNGPLRLRDRKGKNYDRFYETAPEWLIPTSLHLFGNYYDKKI